MYSLAERIQNNSISFRKKIIPYEEYLQLKNAYINLKEKNDILKEEKLKLESLLNKYQLYISDYKVSNNTIKLLFKKLEKKYKDLKFPNFKNISMVKNCNLKIINKYENPLIITDNNENKHNNNYQQKENSLNENNILNKNNEIISTEINKEINKYIEIINKLKNEIRLKEELYQNKIKKSENIFEKSFVNGAERIFQNLLISKNIQINLVKCKEKKEKDIFKTLKISSKISEYNVSTKIDNKDNIHQLKTKNLSINSTKRCEYELLKKPKVEIQKRNLIISSKICELNLIKKSNIKTKEIKVNKNQLCISSNICVFNIIKSQETKKIINTPISIETNAKKELNLANKLLISSKICELNIIQIRKPNTLLFKSSKICEFNIIKKIKPKNKLIISQKTCEYNILNNNKEKKLILLKEIKEKNIFKKNLNISSKICEISISSINKPMNGNRNIQKQSEIFNSKKLTPIINNIYEISSNDNEYFVIKPKKELNFYVCSKISDIYIKRDKTAKEINKIINKEENEQTIKPQITKINSSQLSKKCFLNLKISSKESKIFILNIYNKAMFKKLSIVSSINKINIINKNINKFKNIKICENNEKFILKSIKKELKIVSNICNINLIKKTKKSLLSITSKVSEIIVSKTKLKNIIYKIENQQLNFINFKKKKILRRTTTQKAIIDNYINSINIGFDNCKTYEDYNIINNENDEDSDNENDKLECEPVPSFILCIQKKEKVK